jgi:organic radical activating enzyme
LLLWYLFIVHNITIGIFLVSTNHLFSKIILEQQGKINIAMDCKFFKHGIALSYDHVLKPCCEWRYDDTWSKENHLKIIDIASWHQSSQIKKNVNLMNDNRWPDHCISCKNTEESGRFDSMRGNGNHAYQHYQDDDITLEIRPGSTCNFACQTCWPNASSRVAQYYHRAGLIDIKNINSQSLDNFDFLIPIKHRIKDVILLGGEPFYDKSCQRFLDWALDNLSSRITMFTNGSKIDFEFVKKYSKKLCIVVSLDAIEKPAEYIRFGTEWSVVFSNYKNLKKYQNVERRVNITTSIYNYYYLLDLIELLCQDWPNCVTFGQPRQDWLNEYSLPTSFRTAVIDRLSVAIEFLSRANIETGQKQNAINAIKSIINNLLDKKPWNPEATKKLKDFVQKMDQTKGVNLKDYCSFLHQVIE